MTEEQIDAEYEMSKQYPECLSQNIEVHFDWKDRVKILLTGRLDIRHRTFLGEPVKKVGPVFTNLYTRWPIRWPRKPACMNAVEKEE